MKVEEQHFETIEAYIEQSPGWELDVLQLSPGHLDFSSTLVTFPGVQLVWDRTGAKMEQHTHYQANGIAFGIVLESDARPLFRGHELDFGDAVLWRSGEELEYIAPKGLTALIVQVDEALVELLGWSVTRGSMQRVPRRHLLKLQQGCRQATLAAREQHDIPGNFTPQVALLWRDRILADLEAVLQPWLGGAAYLKNGALLATPHFQLIKKTAYLFAQYDLEKPLAVDALACSLGVSQRTLYHAFRESLGVGPYANGAKLSQIPPSSRRRPGSMPAYECRFPWIPAFAGMTDNVDEPAFSAYLSGIRALRLFSVDQASQAA